MARTVRFRSRDGDMIEGYSAEPLDAAPCGGVVVLHHMPGYDEATKEMTRRLAAFGLAAVCPNLFWREAPGADPDDAAAEARRRGGVPDARVVDDVAGAVAFLGTRSASNGKFGVIGFCSGGRQAFLVACSLPLDAAVDCYGGFITTSPPASVPFLRGTIVELAPQLSCPLLGLFGAEDRYPSPEHNRNLAAALEQAAKEFEFHTYPGASHSFFAPSRASYNVSAAVDGWARIRTFFDRCLAGGNVMTAPTTTPSRRHTARNDRQEQQ